MYFFFLRFLDFTTIYWWVMSDKRSDTIITVIGSVKNVGMLPIAPPKNVDHATAQRPPQ